ncbi:MAG TPA: isochorismatase family protein [Clostridia bacterium]|nr:isochorismatase family protein [Clostridia bacterium]
MEKFTLNAAESLLLVIDIQDRLVAAMSHGAQVIEKTGILLQVAKKLNIPAIVTEQYPKGLGRTVAELPIQEAKVFEKITFTGYTPEVAEALREANRKKIIVTGMETHVCVFQTVRDLLQHGYQVFVVEDAVCSRWKMNFKSGISLMAAMGAVITNTETVFFDLMKKAGTPEFKELSKLIK